LALRRGTSLAVSSTLSSATWSVLRRTMKGDIGSMRFSRHRQESMKVSTLSSPSRSMCRRTRVAWLAIPSIIFRLVLEK
jgi:hypothetical protein